MSRTITMVYATTGGNTKIVCEWVAERLEKADNVVSVHRVETVSPEVLNNAEMLILASPTYGHGQLEPRAIRFYGKQGKHIILTDKPCAVIGLGDSKYDDDYTIESEVLLKEFIREKGGTIVHDSLTIHKTPIPQLRTVVDAWTDQLIDKLK